MKRGIVAALAALMMAMFAVPAQAGSYVVGVEPIDYYPLYTMKDGSYQGYARELLDAFAAKKGHTFEYRSLPFKRLFKSLLVDQDIDFKFPDNQYWSADMREGVNVTYSDPAVDYIDGVMVTPANKGKGVDSLKSLGIIQGFTAWEYLDLIKAGKVTVDTNDQYQGLIKKALRGRVDGAYSNVAVCNYQLKEVMGQPGALVFDSGLPHTASSYFLSTVKHPEVIQEFNAFLKEEKGFVDGLKKKYQVDVQ